MAPSKKPEREQMIARWTAQDFEPHMTVKSEYLPISSSLIGLLACWAEWIKWMMAHIRL